MSYNQNELISYVLMETTTEPSKPRELQSKKIDGVWGVRFYTDLQDFNVKNRNGRNYAGHAMVPAFRTAEIQELLRKKAWLGEFGHPMGKDVDIGRIATIDPKLASHIILSADVNNMGAKGWVESLAAGYGEVFSKYILQGMEPAFSLRALARVERRGGDQIINTQPRIITYDAVILPSHRIAYRDESKPIKICNYDGSTLESTNTMGDCAFTPTMESSINDFIALESTNVKIISDRHEISLENMQVNGDCSSAIIKEGDLTYHIKIEDKIRHDVNSYLSIL